MINDIPVNFTYKGKECKGNLSRSAGAGSNAMYYLNVDGYHYGQLWYVNGHPGFNGVSIQKEGWRFASNQHEELKELSNYFGMIVTTYQGSDD